MRSIVRGVGGFLAGGLITGLIGFGLPEFLPISQAEGAYAMQVAFFWVPLGAIVGAIFGVVLRR